MVGWIAPSVLPSFSGGVARHVRPPSVERSMWTCQPLFSVLEPETIVPLASWTGLSLIGPSTPSGSRAGADHVRPSSCDVMTMPHQALGEGPTL